MGVLKTLPGPVQQLDAYYPRQDQAREPVAWVVDEPRVVESFISRPAPELTVVVPTFNERDNIAPLIESLEAALAGVAWEIIFVDDDSPDGTAAAVRSIARRDRRVRCLQRIGRRGLSSACIEGVLASASPYVAVMDGDLQHDERLLPKMLQVLKNGPCDLVIGSRYVPGGGVGRWNHSRTNISGFATRLSRLICKSGVADPMSGFFMVRREVFESAAHNLSGRGFKILLDLLASSPRPVRLMELPFEFGRRRHGTSKLDTHAGWEFVMMLVEKRIGIVPLRLLLFPFIGILGLALHLGVLWAGLYALGRGFVESQALAAAALINFTFFLSYLLTYRDQRPQGMRLVQSLGCFQLICAAGALANVGVASYVFAIRNLWWMAGTAGAAVGSIWNYAASLVVNHRRR